MFDNEVKTIGLFFFLTFLDDRRAIYWSSRATDLFFHKMKTSPQTKPNVAIVSVTKKMWDKSKGNSFRGMPHFSSDSGWLFPNELDLSPWKEFQKSAAEDELLALTWSQILKIPDEDLSLALGLTQGTIRYRIGRALKKLGSMTRPIPNTLKVVRS